MNFVEINENDKVLRQNADPEPSPIQDSVVTLFPPIHIISSSAGFVKDASPSFGSSKDYLSSSVESHPTSHSSPVLPKGCTEERSGGGDGVTFTLSSATVEGVSVKISIMKGSKIKKAMKKFGKKLNVDSKGLKFTLGGQELRGKELAGDLEGRKIVVWGDLK